VANKKMTMGLIVGNRGFFPDHLAKSGAKRCCASWKLRNGCRCSYHEQSKYGAVETRERAGAARICSRAIVIASMASS